VNSSGTIEPGWVPVPSPHVCAAFLDDEAVLYDVRTARPVLLNTTAAAVWATIDGVLTVAQISSVLADRYATDPGTVAPDVEHAIDRFGALGLLAGQGASPPD